MVVLVGVELDTQAPPLPGPLERALDERPTQPMAACLGAHVQVLEPAVLGRGPHAEPEPQLADGGRAVTSGEPELGVRSLDQPGDRVVERLVARPGLAEV